jgi:site-specific recombinase XerD
MLAAKPIRLRNLTNTRLGVNLVRLGEIYHWCFGAGDTKTRHRIDAPLPQSLTPFIDRWLEVYRPILLRGHSSDALWISLKGKPMGRAAIYERVCLVTEDELGVRINPHAFRSAVATGVAIAMPDSVAITPFLLDHRSEHTAAKHYNLAEGVSASMQYLQKLEARRARIEPPSSPRRQNS